MGSEVGSQNSTDRDQRWNSSTVLLSKQGIQANWRQTRGEQAEGSGTEGCSGSQGRDDEDRSGMVRDKQGRRRGSNPGNSTRELCMLLRTIWQRLMVRSRAHPKQWDVGLILPELY